MPIVADPPSFDFRLGIFDRQELVNVQAFITHAAIERLYVTVIRRLSRSREVELDATLPCPFLERFRGEPGAMIDGQRDWYGAVLQASIEGIRDLVARHREIDLKQGTLATQLIDDGEHPKWPPVEQLVMHKVHAPAFAGRRRLRHGTTMQAHVLASPDTHPELQAVEPIQATHSLLVYRRDAYRRPVEPMVMMSPLAQIVLTGPQSQTGKMP